MTTNEIKTLIQNTIAGQGSQVDIGGKLAEILGAIVDSIPSGEMPRPIVLSRMPQDDDTLEDLAGIGLTLEEIQAAATGKRTGIVLDEWFYPLTNAGYIEETEFEIAFYSSYYANDGTMDALSGCRIIYRNGGLTIVTTEF